MIHTHAAHAHTRRKWKRTDPAPRPAPPPPHPRPSSSHTHIHVTRGFRVINTSTSKQRRFLGNYGEALSPEAARGGSSPGEPLAERGSWARRVGPGRSRRGGAEPRTFSLQTQVQPRRAGKKRNSCWFWFKKQNSKRRKEQISRNNSHTGPEGSLAVER